MYIVQHVGMHFWMYLPGMLIEFIVCNCVCVICVYVQLCIVCMDSCIHLKGFRYLLICTGMHVLICKSIIFIYGMLSVIHIKFFVRYAPGSIFYSVYDCQFAISFSVDICLCVFFLKFLFN
jgi:hypothetical protein